MKRLFPYLLYALLTLFIMFPLYKPGYIFLLDFVFGPKIKLPDLTYGIPAGMPITLFIKFLSLFISTQVIQKILLTLALILPPIFIYKLAGKYLPASWATVSGLFYMLNPYVYERFLAGHVMILLGYAFFPLLIAAFLDFLRKPAGNNFWHLTILFSIYPMINLHWAYMAGLVLVSFFLLNEITGKRLLSHTRFASRILRLLLFTITFLLVNSFWLVNIFSIKSPVSFISPEDYVAYAPLKDETYGVFVNVLSQYGFWLQDYPSPKFFLKEWPFLTILTLILSAAGTLTLIKRKDFSGIGFSLIFFSALFLAVGYSHPFTKIPVKFLFDYLPGYKGLRETGKLIGILSFTYALFAPMGASSLTRFFLKIVRKSLRRFYQAGCITVISLIPILSVNNIFWGFSNQIKPYDYPSSWYRANDILKKENNINNVLFFPWHLYPTLDFAGYVRAASPATVFFDAKIINSQSLDNPFLLEKETGPLNDKIFKLLHGFEGMDENMRFFQDSGITHIILAKISDFDRYNFLISSKMPENIYESGELAVYRINQ